MKKGIVLFGMVFAITSVFLAESWAGPSRGMVCTQGGGQPNEFKVRFDKAVMSPLIWASVFQKDQRIALVACDRSAERSSPKQDVYVCENGVDDRYNANSGNYVVELTHLLAEGTSQAELLQRDAQGVDHVLERLSECVHQ